MRLRALFSTPLRRVLTITGGLLLLIVILGIGYFVAVWADIEQLDFDPEASEELLESSGTTVDPSFFAEPEDFDDIVTTTSLDLDFSGTSIPPEPEVPDPVSSSGSTTTTLPGLEPPPQSGGSGLTGYLIGGSDDAPSIGSADTIYLAVKGSGTVLYAIPRSLYVDNPCAPGTGVRVALLLRGCPGVASGPSLLALGLSRFTGVSISGFATVSYSGFVEIVDALGGITICSDTAQGVGGNVIVPSGCNLLDGSAAAWWVRSRSQDELVDGEWRAVSGDDEQSRSGRQSVAFNAVIKRVLSFSSASSLVSVANKVPGTFALGGMGVGEAASLAMSMRGGYHIAGVPTEQRITPEGNWVLYPTEAFSSTLARNGQ